MQDSFVEVMLIVLTTGLLAGYVCRQISLPLMGYLSVGALLGEGALGWVSSDVEEVAHFAEVGVFLLLFSIGLELSFPELRRMGRTLLVGGGLQMVSVAVPIAAILAANSWEWPAAILVGLALAFSSTVLVFKSLGELGQTSTGLGRRAISILLFQDAALVPLLLCVPLLSGAGGVSAGDVFRLAAVSIGFVAGVVALRYGLNVWLIPRVTRHRSPDLVVLLTLTVLGGVTLVAYRIGLPPALGAFAAGLAFGGNRWSEQVDSLILPFREAFAAVFFVSLGLLIDVSEIFRNPLVALLGVLVLTSVKATAAMVAFWCTGHRFRDCWRPALGLAHVGEFAFVLIRVGTSAGVIRPHEESALITIAGTTLLMSPLFIKWGFGGKPGGEPARESSPLAAGNRASAGRRCLVIGMGPVGRAVASRLETLGYAVSVVDSNPLNLQVFAQQGFKAVAGDAQREHILQAAGLPESRIVVICVPIDEVARTITQQARRMNAAARIVVRCRYLQNLEVIRDAGADVAISEEARSTQELVTAVESQTVDP